MICVSHADRTIGNIMTFYKYAVFIHSKYGWYAWAHWFTFI